VSREAGIRHVVAVNRQRRVFQYGRSVLRADRPLLAPRSPGEDTTSSAPSGAAAEALRSGTDAGGAGWAFELKWDGLRPLVSTEDCLEVCSRAAARPANSSCWAHGVTTNARCR
jgi:hypothetical protein